MKISVGIATYGRPKQYWDTIDELRRELSGHEVFIYVIQDGGELYVKSLRAGTFHVRTSFQDNKGKALYWQTVNSLFGLCKKTRAPIHLQLADDLQFTPGWFAYTQDILRGLGDCMVANILPCHRIETGCWGIHPRPFAPGVMAPGFIDGVFMATAAAMNLIRWRVDPVDSSRWDHNAELGSGVWGQVTRRLTRARARIYNLTDTGIQTDWSGEHSKMNPNRNINDHNFQGLYG